MRRPLLILLVVILAGAALVSGSYLMARNFYAHRLASTVDDLEWLRSEFHLNEQEMQRVRQLHEGYLPKCQEMCGRIAESKKELQAALESSTNQITASVEEKLKEVTALRGQCQTQMLRHFQEISQAMPPEQGRRYLAEMTRLTLGFHEQFERSMSGEPSSPHGHH